MAAEAAAEFDREEADREARRRERANRPSRITNEPVGESLGGRERPAPAATRRPASGANFPGETVSEAAPIADYEERMRRGALPAGRSAAPGPMGQYGESAAAGSVARPRPRPRPPSRPVREAGTGEGGTPQSESTQRPQPEDRGFFSRLFRRTNETGMDPATLEHRRNYYGASGQGDTSYNKKGGLIKAKEAYKKGGLVKPKAASPAKLKGKTMMKKGGMAKGGEAGLASSLRGGVVKKPGTESFNFQAKKKMATGGVVQKGGNKYGFSNANTKMLRRGGMAKGCK